jgi:hypothetical protein
MQRMLGADELGVEGREGKAAFPWIDPSGR